MTNDEMNVFLGFTLFIGIAVIMGLPLGWLIGLSSVKHDVCKYMYIKTDDYIKCQSADLDDILKRYGDENKGGHSRYEKAKEILQ